MFWTDLAACVFLAWRYLKENLYICKPANIGKDSIECDFNVRKKSEYSERIKDKNHWLGIQTFHKEKTYSEASSFKDP